MILAVKTRPLHPSGHPLDLRLQNGLTAFSILECNPSSFWKSFYLQMSREIPIFCLFQVALETEHHPNFWLQNRLTTFLSRHMTHYHSISKVCSQTSCAFLLSTSVTCVKLYLRISREIYKS